MKKFFYLLSCAALLLTGCYDDSALWSKMDDFDQRLQDIESVVNRLNSEVSALKTIITSSASSKAIIDVTETTVGYAITFSDGTSITIRHGSDGADGDDGAAGTAAPIIGVSKESDGIYYWTVTYADGTTDWLYYDETKTQKIPVTGPKGETGDQGDDGITPVMGVDAEGFWTVDYGEGPKRIIDANGNAVPAGGTAGDSLFEDIDTSDDDFVVFSLSNGEVIVVPRTRAVFALADKSRITLPAGETAELELEIKNIQYAEVIKTPEGWSASIDIENGTATVTAPATDGVQSGLVSFLGMDDNMNVLLLGVLVEVEKEWGYADPEGTFIVVEGNMTSENGTLIWFDSDMNMYESVFEDANGGLEIGNVVQDMYIANDRIYLITQNGDSRGGAGRFVVCDAKTMKMEYALPLAFFPENNSAGTHCWPQHIAVVSDSKAYIQWAESGMEATSGIRVMDLASRTISPTDIEGTFGAFTTEGATKGRMVYSRGKLFAGTGHSVAIIDTDTDEVEKKIEFGAQVKGIVKAADNNIYVLLAREYSGTSPNAPGTFTTNTRIVGLDHAGNIVHDHYLPDEVDFPVATWSPKIQVCASFNEPYLYFTDKNEFYFSSIARYNYETNETTTEFVRTDDIYGYLGIHPVTEELWVTSSSTANWTKTEIRIFDTASGEQLRTYTGGRGFAAGVDFAYRFTDEFVNR